MNERTGWPRIGPIVLLLGALSVLSIGGCSLQCLSESECLAKGPAFANTTCDPTTKTCVALQSGQDLCKATTDCVTSHGPEYICRRSDKKCVALKTPECPFLMDSPTIASYKDPNVIILGALTPANDNALGTMMEKSVELAQQDFSTSDNFLPPVTGTTATRPVVIVGCNEFGAGNDGLLRAANHLVKDLQVPIILGPVDSGNDAVVEVNVALPNKVLSILPTSTLSGLSSLPSMSTALLTWRLNYSDATLASTVGDLFKTVLPARAQTLGIIHAGDPLKVAVIEENNLFGLTIGGKVQAQIQFNGKSAIDNAQDQPPHYMLGNVGDQRDTVNNPRPDATVAAVVAAVLQFQPHIIVHASAVIDSRRRKPELGLGRSVSVDRGAGRSGAAHLHHPRQAARCGQHDCGESVAMELSILQFLQGSCGRSNKPTPLSVVRRDVSGDVRGGSRGKQSSDRGKRRQPWYAEAFGARCLGYPPDSRQDRDRARRALKRRQHQVQRSIGSTQSRSEDRRARFGHGGRMS